MQKPATSGAVAKINSSIGLGAAGALSPAGDSAPRLSGVHQLLHRPPSPAAQQPSPPIQASPSTVEASPLQTPAFAVANGGTDVTGRRPESSRMRSSIACIKCRKSKTKCDNKGLGSTCSSCATSGKECIYPSPATVGNGSLQRRESLGATGEHDVSLVALSPASSVRMATGYGLFSGRYCSLAWYG